MPSVSTGVSSPRVGLANEYGGHRLGAASISARAGRHGGRGGRRPVGRHVCLLIQLLLVGPLIAATGATVRQTTRGGRGPRGVRPAGRGRRRVRQRPLLRRDGRPDHGRRAVRDHRQAPKPPPARLRAAPGAVRPCSRHRRLHQLRRRRAAPPRRDRPPAGPPDRSVLGHTGGRDAVRRSLARGWGRLRCLRAGEPRADAPVSARACLARRGKAGARSGSATRSRRGPSCEPRRPRRPTSTAGWPSRSSEARAASA